MPWDLSTPMMPSSRCCRLFTLDFASRTHANKSCLYSQHVQKLRKNRNVSAIGGTPAGTPKTTPSNAGTKIPGSRKRAASAKNILKAENGSEMDDEDIFKIKREKKESDEDGTPSMPAAKRVKKLAE